MTSVSVWLVRCLISFKKVWTLSIDEQAMMLDLLQGLVKICDSAASAKLVWDGTGKSNKVC